jgi:hypothetical protein
LGQNSSSHGLGDSDTLRAENPRAYKVSFLTKLGQLAGAHMPIDWTLVHGFFAAMGGFVLHDDDNQSQTLSLKNIEDLVREGKIEYPIISKREIKDKSKGNVLAKGLVLIQTMWFLLQCVARGAQHLSITELELATAAFALLNLITYSLWWDKPLNVECPVRVRKKHVCGQEDGGEVVSGNKEADQGGGQEQDEVTAERTKEHAACSSRVRDRWSRFWRRWTWRNIQDAVLSAFLMIFGPFASMIKEHEEDNAFYAGKNEDEDQSNKAVLGALVASMAFGAIHCIAWLFSFPSRMEQLIWKMSSITITGVPVFIATFIFVVDGLPKIARVPIVNLFFLSPILYLLARVVLLVLALMALRSLPPSGLQTVQWTTFLPHV